MGNEERERVRYREGQKEKKITKVEKAREEEGKERE